AALEGPYRVFYLEMVEAALHYWRTQRPSPIESTWNWGVALRQLGDLIARGVRQPVATATCANCRAIRPFDQDCLRCGEHPDPLGAVTAPSAYASSARAAVAPSSQPMAPPPPPIVTASPVVAPTAPVSTIQSPIADAPTEPAILP